MFQCWVFCHNCARLKFWIAHHCRSLCLSFSINSNSLLLSKMCDTSKMIIRLLIWEGNVYLHSFMFWLSLSSEVINEGSSCFHMKISSLFFFVFVLSGVVFFMDDQEEKQASVVFHENFLEVKSFTLIEMLYKIVQ